MSNLSEGSILPYRGDLLRSKAGLDAEKKNQTISDRISTAVEMKQDRLHL